MNRLTITLDDELYAMARAHAIASKTSLSKAVADLLRNRHAKAPGMPAAEGDDSYFDEVLGVRVSRAARALTLEEVERALADEDVRHLEPMESPQDDSRRSEA
jgi:hypothetical protein